MNTAPETHLPAGSAAKPISLKIFGVGSAGLTMLEQIAGKTLQGAACIAVGTRADSLAPSSAAEKICLESKLLRGLGTGGDPERGRAAAEESADRLKASCEGADVVFIVAGLGGGAGTGISPVLARIARETGALVLAFVTLPFDCEGNRRRNQAQHGLLQLKAEADGVICLPNQKMVKLIDDRTSVADTFKITNEFLADGLKGVWRLLARKGLIEIHFADLCALLRDRHGESAFATAQADGPTRSREAVDQLLAHPMLDAGKTLADSDAVLVGMVGGPDLTMVEVSRVMEHINSKCPRAQVMMGAAIDEDFRERLAITLIATRRNESPAAQAGSEAAARTEAAHPVEQLDKQLLNRVSGARPHSRFVPPPPSMAPEQMEQLMAKQATGAARPRKTSARMRQGQLPLEIISKGRFDKSEPTIHKGEDLDVPTYIRRGVSLN
jgi:cell division protein FtsZ